MVVDCAPTGAALRLLTLPEMARAGLRLLLRVQRALASVVTPLARSLVAVPLPGAAVFRDAEHADLPAPRAACARLLGDARTSVRLVVTPERMVIDEALRARTDLALFELGCDAVVMNRLLPEARRARGLLPRLGPAPGRAAGRGRGALRAAARAARAARARTR